MRIILIISLALVLPTILLAQQTYVPDDNFEKYLIAEGFDEYPLNDSVPTANIESLRALALWHLNISDLTGIEDFTALMYLNCWNNKLTSLDISNNSALVSLMCYKNKLTSLDVSNNSALAELDCSQNHLKSLDVSNNTGLVELECNWNRLANLDVSMNTSLRIMYCYYNNLTILNLSNNIDLEILWCHNNNFTGLDLSKNSDLEFLNCSYNNLTSLNIKNGNNTNITGSQSGLYFDARNNPDLECIQVDDSVWSSNEFKWRKDEHAYYSEDCGYTGIDFRVVDETDNISISSSPNPFSQSTMINYQLAMPGRVVLKVYNNLGREISTLIDEFQDAGEHQAVLNAENLPQGIYFYKIQIDNATRSGKLLLIR